MGREQTGAVEGPYVEGKEHGVWVRRDAKTEKLEKTTWRNGRRID